MKLKKLILALALTFSAMGLAELAHAADPAAKSPSTENTLSPDEVARALEDLGGNAAKDLAKVIESLFAQSGRPNAVIVGSEAQGSFFVGYRKGSGKFLLPGEDPARALPIYWNAPSVGINVGASANKVAILVYGARSADDLMRRFASVQGSYHLVAGAGVSYLRSSIDPEDKDAISLAYVTVGVGLDAGVAVEALSFTKTDRWF